MTTFIYKNNEIKGILLEETKTHYIIEIENEDQMSLPKEITTKVEIEYIREQMDVLEIVKQVGKGLKREGNGLSKLWWFRKALEKNVIERSAESYKKYTKKQLELLVYPPRSL